MPELLIKITIDPESPDVWGVPLEALAQLMEHRRRGNYKAENFFSDLVTLSGKCALYWKEED